MRWPIAIHRARTCRYVNFYRAAPSAFLCVCLRSSDAKEAAAAAVAAAEGAGYKGNMKGVIPGFICSTTAEVDGWHATLEAAGVEITKAAGPGISSDLKEIDAIYNVMCKDPSG